MSESVFARLPRFDAVIPPKDDPEETQTIAEPERLADEVMIPVDVHEPCVAQLPDPIDYTAAFDAAISALALAAEDLREKRDQQIVHGISQIASELFPQLCELFLAEEIARELPGLLKQTVSPAEVQAHPDLCVPLQQACERLTSAREALRITCGDKLEPGQIDIVWPDGGARFDYSALLAAATRRLGCEIRVNWRAAQ